MAVDVEAIKRRAAAIQATLWAKNAKGETLIGAVHGARQGTLTLLELIYGHESSQVKEFVQATRQGADPQETTMPWTYEQRLAGVLWQYLQAAVADLEAGVVGTVTIRAKGEVLGDFMALARAALALGDPGGDKVAAVLAAAALEETLKQLGEERGLDVYNRPMQGVIEKLRTGGALVGPDFNLARGLVEFRDKASHGQFDQISRGTTESALTFASEVLGRGFH
jgi:hypothetical protein